MTFEIVNAGKPQSVKLSDGTVLEEAMSLKAVRQYGWVYDETTNSVFVRFPWNYTNIGIQVD